MNVNRKERWAVEIKLRAERKAGLKLCEMKERGELRVGPSRSPTASKRSITRRSNRSSGLSGMPLRSLGITFNQSSEWQKTAAIPERALPC
jgi:hypothetical protein